MSEKFPRDFFEVYNGVCVAEDDSDAFFRGILPVNHEVESKPDNKDARMDGLMS